MNADAILRNLSQIRTAIPQLPQPRPEINSTEHGAALESDAFADFECAAVADALEAMADDLAAAIDDAQTTLVAKCLEVYYVAEELSRDPAHADLIPCVEEMRRAYRQSYGRPIPLRKP
jgi:hypothetical protein